ncbi:acid phosphatase [Phenylobacterium soli]|uniref:Acid phosphatase n=1 Tax=Phenylobacterium soli TaxID=2170551 RepID=A0A328AGC7_9CAUL|nr:phosphatase PAP2 family protein [Phenylobacterium soli]RAK53913.1 phosphatase PAP2 family protein [Phenylobacterium soli]
MTFKYLLTGAVLAAAIAAGAGLAQALPAHGPSKTPSGPPVAGHLTGYLKSDDIDGEAVIGPPPAPESPRGQADRQIYLATRAEAGSPRWSEAVRDNDLWKGGAVERYGCALGVRIDAKATPVTYRMLQRIELDVRTVGTPPKDHYGRIRPLIGDDRPVCVPREDWMKTNASYPSGHAMAGWAWALVLSEIEPAKTGPLMAAGSAIGDSRVICGVHYQSDVEAGRKLGAAMVARLHSEPQFRKDLAAARAELARDRKAPLRCDYAPAGGRAAP